MKNKNISPKFVGYFEYRFLDLILVCPHTYIRTNHVIIWAMLKKDVTWGHQYTHSNRKIV